MTSSGLSVFVRHGVLAVSILSAGAAGAATYTGTLSGAAESPPNLSTATGQTTVTYNAATHMLGVQITFAGLSAADTAAHIHCCTTVPFTGTAGVATTTPTFSGFPTGVTSGTYTNTLDLTLAGSFNPAFVTANGSSVPAAEAALVAGLNGGQAYMNIHTSTNPGGEIRAFLNLLVEPVPALSPGSLGLLAFLLGAASLLALRRV